MGNGPVEPSVVGRLEVRVTGKGDRQRVVPLSPGTARELSDYIKRRSNGSPYAFPDGSGTRPMCADSFDRTLLKGRRGGLAVRITAGA